MYKHVNQRKKKSKTIHELTSKLLLSICFYSANKKKNFTCTRNPHDSHLCGITCERYVSLQGYINASFKLQFVTGSYVNITLLIVSKLTSGPHIVHSDRIPSIPRGIRWWLCHVEIIQIFTGNFILWAVKSNEISMGCLGYSVPGHVNCCPVCYITRSDYQVGAGRQMFSDLLSEAKSILRVVHIHYWPILVYTFEISWNWVACLCICVQECDKQKINHSAPDNCHVQLLIDDLGQTRVVLAMACHATKISVSIISGNKHKEVRASENFA